MFFVNRFFDLCDAVRRLTLGPILVLLSALLSRCREFSSDSLSRVAGEGCLML
jgi:hypothetical protein